MKPPSPWTNEALAPSLTKERPMEDTYHVLTVLGVPECARTPVTINITTNTGWTPMMVSREGIQTKQFDLLPVMNMSARKKEGGDDYATRVYVNSEPFTGTAYTYRCNGYYGAIGYMPKCQNLGVLEMRDPSIRDALDHATYILGGIPGITNFNDYLGGSEVPESPIDIATVPSPGTAALIVVGSLIAILFSRKNHANKS